MFKSDNSTSHSSTSYDQQVRNTIPYYDAFHEQTINLIKAAAKPRAETWLDTGCGTGTLTGKAVAAFPDTKFILADPSPQMLQAAKTKLANKANITFIEAPTQNLTLQKGSFDVITAIQSHHYLNEEDRTKATKACFDLLTKSGIYITFENTKPATPEGIQIGKEMWRQFQLSKGKSSQAVEEHLKRFGIEYHPIPIKEHIKLLKETGFSTVELLWYSYMQAGFYAVK